MLRWTICIGTLLSEACASRPKRVSDEYLRRIVERATYDGNWLQVPQDIDLPFVCQQYLPTSKVQGRAAASAAGDAEAIVDSLCNGWVVWNDKCYRAYGPPLSFSEAQLFCEQTAFNGTLASVSSPEENALVSRLCETEYDSAGACYTGIWQRSVESEWINSEGFRASYMNYGRGSAEVPGGAVAVTTMQKGRKREPDSPQPTGVMAQMLPLMLFTIALLVVAGSLAGVCLPFRPRQGGGDAQAGGESPSQSTTRGTRVDTRALSGLRAICSVVIMTGHCLTFNTAAPLELEGGMAVTVFLFISGFIMTLAYGERCHDANFETTFLVRRAARLFPVHWFALFISYPLLVSSLPPLPTEVLLPAVVLGVPLTLVLMQSWWVPCLLTGGNGASWTMSTLFFFYLTFGMVARWMTRRYQRVGICSFVLYSILSILVPVLLFGLLRTAGFDEWACYSSARAYPLARMPLLCLGMLTALKAKEAPGQAPREAVELEETSTRSLLTEETRRFPTSGCLANMMTLLIFAIWLFGVIINMAGYVAGENHFRFRGLFELVIVPLLPIWTLSLCSERDSAVRRFLTHPVLQRLGEWSFCVYLMQFPIWDWTRVAVFGTMHKKFPATVLPLSIAEVIAGAALCHRLIEKPSKNRLIPQLEKLLGAGSPGAGSTVQLQAVLPQTLMSEAPSSSASPTEERFCRFQCGHCQSHNQVRRAATTSPTSGPSSIIVVCGACRTKFCAEVDDGTSLSTAVGRGAAFVGA
eukprot:TRINITY_DN24960_c0_g1_i1.p1 TRINITY_DN24960_c0_g1~~TRINITY_DN24960_c0_g1_i1.p1  ORF type:complete len:752 (+),score=85.95 TRINITY_DN24960_c0_g1_i1:70-2325(+)